VGVGVPVIVSIDPLYQSFSSNACMSYMDVCSAHTHTHTHTTDVFGHVTISILVITITIVTIGLHHEPAKPIVRGDMMMSASRSDEDHATEYALASGLLDTIE
jgi:hypothetical protein